MINCFLALDINSFIVKFSLKSIKNERHLLIFCKNQDEIEFLDDYLWRYDFIPHAKITEEDIQDEVIVLLTKDQFSKNLLKANTDFLFTYQENDSNFLSLENKKAILLTNENTKYPSNIEAKYYKQESGKFVEY